MHRRKSSVKHVFKQISGGWSQTIIDTTYHFWSRVFLSYLVLNLESFKKIEDLVQIYLFFKRIYNCSFLKLLAIYSLLKIIVNFIHLTLFFLFKCRFPNDFVYFYKTIVSQKNWLLLSMKYTPPIFFKRFYF